MGQAAEWGIRHAHKAGLSTVAGGRAGAASTHKVASCVPCLTLYVYIPWPGCLARLWAGGTGVWAVCRRLTRVLCHTCAVLCVCAGVIRYFDPDTVGLDFKGMMEDITAAPDGSIILLHGEIVTDSVAASLLSNVNLNTCCGQAELPTTASSSLCTNTQEVRGFCWSDACCAVLCC